MFLALEQEQQEPEVDSQESSRSIAAQQEHSSQTIIIAPKAPEQIKSSGSGSFAISLSSLNNVGVALQAAREQYETGMSLLNADISAGQKFAKKREEDILERENLLIKKESDRKSTAERLAELPKSFNEQANQVKNQETLIKQLQAELGESQSQAGKPHKHIPVTHAAGVRKLDLHGSSFEEVYSHIPRGVDNAGMFKEQIPRQVQKDGKPFKETLLLAQIPKPNIEGETTNVTNIFDAIPFSRYSKGSLVKWVQDIGPQSLIENDGQYYIGWEILQEEANADYAV